MSKWTAGEVRSEAAEVSDYGGTTAGDMLTAYAEILEQDARAVPVDEMRTSLIKALMDYRCSRTVDEDGEGLPLVDVLSPGEDSTIQLGTEEIEYLAEYLADELPIPPAQASESAVREVFVCSNPSCRAAYADDPNGHCPTCIQPNGVGWSTLRMDVQ